MNKKISKILGVAVTFALLASLMVASIPASAFTLSWTSEKDPTDLVENTIVTNTDIYDIVANGDVVYAGTSNSTLPLYKSTDGGATWSSLANTTSFPTGVYVKAIAVASDDADTVAIITSANEVEYSTNGGSSWTDLNNPTNSSSSANATLNCIDIAPGTTRYLAVGGALSGGAVMYTIKLTMAETWTERYQTGIATNGANSTQTTMAAVKFSPNFSTEKAITAVTGGTASARFQIFRYELGDYEWNGKIDYLDLADWGTGIDLGYTVTGGVAKASMALPTSYMANDEGSRLAYIGIGATTSGGGVCRLTDTIVKDFQTWSGGDEGEIGSVVYNEAGKVIAGSLTDNKVYQFLSPTDVTPKASRLNTLKMPGGENNTVVTLSGDTVLSGTSGDESCVSSSTDDGYSFNDIALIDTTLTVIDDFAVNADGSKVYLVTNDGANTSVWLKGTNYVRVLSLPGVTGAIIRIAPNDDTVAYLADTGGTATSVWVTKNSGMETWKAVPCYKVTSVKDMAVESADVVYVLDSAAGQGVSKTTNAGASWGDTKEPTETVNPNMLTLAPNGDVLVGGSNGYVSFSKDAGATFSRTKLVSSGSNIFVVADDDYATNNIIYAAYGSTVKRGKADTTTTYDSRGDLDTGTSVTVTGIAQVQEVTYVLTANSSASRLYKCLKLETAGSATLAEWTYIGVSSNYQNAPQALKMSLSGTTPKLWAVDTTGDDLDSITDPIALAGPTLKEPSASASVAVNAGTGRSYDITFIVNRYASSAIDEIQLQIATDSTFDAIIYDNTFTGITTDTIAKVIGPTGQASQVAEFMPGETYYWRVRTGATGPWYSPWSESRSFAVASPDTFMVSGPAVGASDTSLMPTFTWAEYPDAIGYEIMLSEDPTFAIIEWSYNVANPFYKTEEALKYSTTYYWRVRGVTGESVLKGSTWVTPAGPWVTGIFTTMAEPVVTTTEPIVITQPGQTEVKIVEVPVTSAPVVPTYILWVIVGIGAILVIALVVLIVRTRRVA